MEEQKVTVELGGADAHDQHRQDGPSWRAAPPWCSSATRWCWWRRAPPRSPSPDRDFVPLTVDYRERTYAAGKIPGGFFKREGRPTEKEVLTLAADRPSDPAAVPQGVPLRDADHGHRGVVRPGERRRRAGADRRLGGADASPTSRSPSRSPACASAASTGEFVVNPTFAQLDESDMDMVVAGTADNIIMVEGGTREVTEADLIAALEFAHGPHPRARRRSSATWCAAAGKPKRPLRAAARHRRARAVRSSRATASACAQAIRIPGKEARQEEVDRITRRGGRRAQGALRRAGSATSARSSTTSSATSCATWC